MKFIRGGDVLRRRDGRWVSQRADIEISGDRIAAVIEAPDAAAPGPEDLDASRHLVIPGLVNAHLHSNDNFLRGRVERVPLEIYMLTAVPISGVRPLSVEDLEARTLLGAMEGLKTGSTCFLDDCYHLDGVRPEAIDTVLGAYERIGARAGVTANLSDRPMPDTVPFVRDYLDQALYNEITRAHKFDADEALACCEAAIGRYNSIAGRVRFAMAASGPQRCTDALLQRIWEIAERHRVPCVTHVLETRTQAIASEIEYGETLVAHMARLGCLTPRTVLIHGVWVTDEDITAIAESGATVVHNPTSNLRLGSGVAPVRKLLDAGVRLALGTDGISTNDSLNLLLEMRLAGCLHNIKGQPHEQWLDAHEVFSMATIGGAQAVGLDRDLGLIEPGMLADLTLLDANSTALVPLNEPVRNIVHAEYGQSVRTVLVGGEVVVKDGRLTRIDEKEILGRAREAADRFFTDNAEAFARVAEFLPAFEEAFERARRTDHTTKRWVAGE